MVQSDQKRRLLALHAAKEVVTHCSRGQLEAVADLLWGPLFDNSQTTEEATRNVAAACLGKLATTHPSKYLPQLHVRWCRSILLFPFTHLAFRLALATPILMPGLRSFLPFDTLSPIRHHLTTSFCLLCSSTSCHSWSTKILWSADSHFHR